MGVWQGVAMDSLKYYFCSPCLTLQRLAGRPLLRVVSGVARLQGGRPAAIFYPLGHPTPYAYTFGGSSFSLRNQNGAIMVVIRLMGIVETKAPNLKIIFYSEMKMKINL
jgi:hypothetical protein